MTTHLSDFSYSMNFKAYVGCLDTSYLSDNTVPEHESSKFLTRIQSFLPNTGVKKKEGSVTNL